jgi:hypothetical protein
MASYMYVVALVLWLPGALIAGGLGLWRRRVVSRRALLAQFTDGEA